MSRSLPFFIKCIVFPGLIILILIPIKLGLVSAIAVESPFFLFWAAILISIWYGGTIAGLTATLLASLASSYFFISPLSTFGGHSVGQYLSLILFLLEGGLISVLVGTLHEGERRYHSKAVQLSDLLYQITENMREVFWISSPNQEELVYISPAYEQVWGRRRSILYQEPERFQDAIHPDDREQVSTAWQELVQNQGEQYDDEYRIVKPDGGVRWVRSRVFPIRRRSGDIFRIAGVSEDVTDRRLAEAALQQSKARLKHLADNLPGVIYQYRQYLDGRPGEFTYISPGCNALCGLRPEAVLDNPKLAWSRIHPDDLEAFRRSFHQRSAETEHWQWEWRITTVSGELKWVQGVAHPARQGDGSLLWDGLLWDITDRKQMENELQRREQQFRMLADNAPDIIVRLDRNLRHVYVSPAIERATGHPPEAFIGKRFEELGISTSIYTPHQFVMQQCFVDGRECFFEFDSSTPDGTRYYQTYMVPERAPDGSVEYLLGITRDVTDYRLVEQALQESESRFRVALKNSPIMVFNQDRNLRYTWIYNPHPYFPSDAAVGKTDAEVVPSELVDRLTQMKRRVIETATGDRDEIQLLIDGTLHTYDITLEPLYDAAGAVAGLTGAAVDITERKWAEESLQRSESRFRRLVESNIFGVAFNTPTGKFMYVNDAFTRMVGYSRDELLSGQIGWQDITPLEYFQRDLRADEELNRSSVFTPFEKEYIRKDGTRIPVLIGGALLQDHSDSPPAAQDREVVCFYLDLTQQKRIEQEREQMLTQAQAARAEAEAANRVKDEFLAVLSHELRTPLNPILGWTQLLRRRQLDQDSTAHALDTIERNAKLQAQLVDDLLDVSRILQGKLRLQVSSVNLPAVIEAAIETVQLAISAKSIQIQTHYDESVKTILGDPNRLQQVVWNLLSNAVKFTPPGGQITVRLEKQTEPQAGERDRSDALPADSTTADYAVMQVTDTGQGIHPNFLPYVFDYFRQADSTTTRTSGGLGLGLAIVRHLVELHGGIIYAESLGEGQGATFTVKLPLSAAQSVDGRGLAPSSVENTQTLADTRVLLVEDRADTREVMAVMMQQWEIEVTAVASVREAIAALNESSFDLLISDIGMPESDGYDLIRQVRAMPADQGGQIPAIALTAYARVSDRYHALAAGFQQHLTKPVDANELAESIINVLSAR